MKKLNLLWLLIPLLFLTVLAIQPEPSSAATQVGDTELVLFFDDFSAYDSSKQATLVDVSAPPYIYNRSTSSLGYVMREIMDPLALGRTYENITRTSGEVSPPWTLKHSAGATDTATPTIYTTELHMVSLANGGRSTGLSHFPQEQVVTAGMQARVDTKLKLCNEGGPESGPAIGYYNPGGAYITAAVTYECHATDRIVFEVWSNQYGSNVNIYTNVLKGTAHRNTWYLERIVISPSNTMYGCSGTTCASLPMTSLVKNGQTYDLRLSRLVRYDITNRTYEDGEIIETQVRDAFLKWSAHSSVLSTPIYPSGGGFLRFEESHQNRGGAMTFDILIEKADGSQEIRTNVPSGYSLAGITDPIRLRANFSRGSLDNLSPILDWWRVVGMTATPTPTPPTPPPTPDPEIVTILLNDLDWEEISIPEGDDFILRIEAENVLPGGSATPGEIYVSFPNQETTFLGYVQSTGNRSSDLAYTELSNQPVPVLRGRDSTWQGGETNVFEVRVSPPEAGLLPIDIKAVFYDAEGAPYRDPLSSSYSDFAGDPVYRRTVRVVPVSDPLDRLNYYRGLAGVGLVTENAYWSQGDADHARYMVENSSITHDEDPSNAYYTYEGFAAGQSSHVVGFSNENTPTAWSIDLLMQSPLHALPMLNPKLTQVGYGEYRNDAKAYPSGSALDVRRGEDYLVTGTYPVYWPPAGGQAPLVAYTGDAQPDPIAHCGYRAPTGAPVWIMVSDGMGDPQVSASSFSGNGTALAHCVYDSSTYTNPNPNLEDDGRDILDYYDAVVLIPQAPLMPGVNYAVSLTIDGQPYNWNFTVVSDYVPGITGTVR